MTGATFIIYVKAKLNRLDTAHYEDVRDEEVLLFGNEALKDLTLSFDSGLFSPKVDARALQVYLDSLVDDIDETNCTANKAASPAEVLKLKDIEAFVTIGDESGWMPAISRSNDLVSHRQDNPFEKSYPDRPNYRVLDGEIVFDTDGSFAITKFRGKKLIMPAEFDASTTLSYPFMEELENKTVTLLLENLESRRIETQPVVSKM